MNGKPTDSDAARALLEKPMADTPMDDVSTSLAKRDAWVRQTAADCFDYLRSRSNVKEARDAFQAVLDQNKRPAHRPPKGASPEVRTRRVTLATFVELHLTDGSVAKRDRTVSGAARRYYGIHGGQSIEAVEKNMRDALRDYPIKDTDTK